ncbi:RagB/SusD family nutrient uptake outer membrane protein [Flavivirga abyssicola]|uniref:RagB/SusD family nutrient uptake outer membrane protein n=1 Tax=Flavivirga abyssicola TaxID=3063533 RepID=UPI0026E0D52C|nr:RagB/SusD family nutrient uptake outer membrane protein [Flavivirga sp. MEBiC07777]WVK12737.1 RagB/SusD family nutrient uptake outer membrane protein [Flavivirga sp. MEBiC07777]
MLHIYKTYSASFKNLKLLLLVLVILNSCSDFLEVEVPSNEIEPSSVFSNTVSVKAAFAGVYSQIRENGIISGTRSRGSSILLGLYTDELQTFNENNNPFFLNDLDSEDATVSNYWGESYNNIFEVNKILDGIQNSDALTAEDKNEFRGQALFLRAFFHSMLVQLFGDIPYVTTTNHEINKIASRASTGEVYAQIIKDLLEAKSLLGITNRDNDIVFPDKITAEALLARVYLYTEDWTNAAQSASFAIDNVIWEPDVNEVFIHEFFNLSEEGEDIGESVIWSLKTDILNNQNTNLGASFIIQENTANFDGRPILTNDLINAFDLNDKRRDAWVGSLIVGSNTLFFPTKYKEPAPTSPVTKEYPIILRLAEQYLIRAEARAMLGDIPGAKDDINIIRTRAGLPNVGAFINSQEGIIEAIIRERRVEFFTEFGHRFYDLKRTGYINAVLTEIKPNWNPEGVLLPIPQRELDVNLNLLPQNPGYQ